MRKAFTMLEFLVVLLVVGILSVAIVPQMRSNKLMEAATQVVSHIRYTQHLAMIDDKFNASDSNWFKKRWQIIFANYSHKNPKKQNVAYSVFSDNSLSGKPDISEMAIDPLNKKVLSGGHSNLDDVSFNNLDKQLSLSDTYGITAYKLSGGCAYARISFDHFGRPIKKDLSASSKPYEKSRLIKTQCQIKLSSLEGNITIAIEPETGYTHIL